MFFGRYNTLAEQVNENQKNIKTLSDAYDVIANDYSTTFKVLDLSMYSNNSVLPPEIVSELSQDNIAIIYNCQVNYDTYKAIYNISSRGAITLEFIATSSQPDHDGDNYNVEISINKVMINVNNGKLTYSYETRRVIDDDKLNAKLEDKMTIVDLSNYNDGATISEDDYNLLLNDNTYVVYKKVNYPYIKILYTQRNRHTGNLVFTGSVSSTQSGSIDIDYYTIRIDVSTRVVRFSNEKYFRTPSTIIDLREYYDGDTLPQALVEEMLKGNCVALVSTSNYENILCSCVIDSRGDIKGSGVTGAGNYIAYVNFGVRVDELEFLIEEYEKPYLTYSRSNVLDPQYNADFDGYVCDIRNLPTGSYRLKNWNEDNYYTRILIGNKRLILPSDYILAYINACDNIIDGSDNEFTFTEVVGVPGGDLSQLMIVIIEDFVLITIQYVR